MEEQDSPSSDSLSSSRNLAFTIPFSDVKVNSSRLKNLSEKYSKQKNQHHRGHSLSKLENHLNVGEKVDSTVVRKFSFHSEGYYSDERSTKIALENADQPLLDLRLPLDTTTKLSEHDLKLFESPTLDRLSPYSPARHNCGNGDGSDNEMLFVDGNFYEFDKKSETSLSDTGTYTLDAEKYTEEQKARMSIDSLFRIDKSVIYERTEQYVKSLTTNYMKNMDENNGNNKAPDSESCVARSFQKLDLIEHNSAKRRLSPIVSPTDDCGELSTNSINLEGMNATFSKSPTKSTAKMSPKSKASCDRGNIISVTLSGAFRKTPTQIIQNTRPITNLAKSEIQIEAYPNASSSPIKLQFMDDRPSFYDKHRFSLPAIRGNGSTSTPNRADVSETYAPFPYNNGTSDNFRHSGPSSFNYVELGSDSSSIETERYLQPTQQFINALEQKLHQELPTRLTQKHQPSSTRNKDLRPPDGTLNALRKSSSFTFKNQTLKNAQVKSTPNSNVRKPTLSNGISQFKPSLEPGGGSKHLRGEPMNLNRSSSTANIRRTETESSSEEDHERRRKDNAPNTRLNRTFSLRRARADNILQNTTGAVTKPNAGYGTQQFKCPLPVDIGRKPSQLSIRATSADRRLNVTNHGGQSRYLSNLSSSSNRRNMNTQNPMVSVRSGSAASASSISSSNYKPLVRNDGGRSSLKSNSSTKAAQHKKKDTQSRAGGRCNSSLSSREVEFQNWKRRKSYDPMRAAAEGKKKELQKRRSMTTQSNNPSSDCNDSCLLSTDTINTNDCDNSPSHSSSVHRSQSFHGTAPNQMNSPDEDDTASPEDDLSPATSSCDLSPEKIIFRKGFL